MKLSLGSLCPPQQQMPRLPSGPFLENPIFSTQSTTQPLMGTSRPESGVWKKHFCKFSSADAVRVHAGTMGPFLSPTEDTRTSSSHPPCPPSPPFPHRGVSAVFPQSLLLCSRPGINPVPSSPRNFARQRRRKPEALPEDIPRASHPPQILCQLPVALAASQPPVWLHFSLLDFSTQEPLLLKKNPPQVSKRATS